MANKVNWYALMSFIDPGVAAGADRCCTTNTYNADYKRHEISKQRGVLEQNLKCALDKAGYIVDYSIRPDVDRQGCRSVDYSHLYKTPEVANVMISLRALVVILNSTHYNSITTSYDGTTG